MEEKSSNIDVDESSYLKEPESEQSFVGKVRSIITNTPLSKWFRKEQVIRRRDEDLEDDTHVMQPPTKRVKLPEDGDKTNFSSVYSERVVSNEVKKHSKICDYFPEPVAGPSGIHPNSLANGISINSVHERLTNSDISNRRKDSDSEESTSGYSSVAKIGSKEQVYQSPTSSKQTSPRQNAASSARSLFQTTPKPFGNQDSFADRSTSTHLNTSLSSRRPSFNASTFGSPNFVDRTLLTKKIVNSPFYNGRTIYGGASAYGHNLGRTPQDLKTNLKSSVQIKPINKSNESGGNVVLGKTARRILETLEQYSSPVNDAKKIPVVSKKSRDDGILTRFVGANPYFKKCASNKELNVPSVSDLLKMKQKNRLQDTTEAVRQIATSSKSNLNTESYKLSSESEKEKHTSKMKTKITNVRQKVVIEETVPEVNLNPVSLPITNLPKFDFVIPPPVTSQPIKESPQKSNTVPAKEQVIPIFTKPQLPQKSPQKSSNSDFEKNSTLSSKTTPNLGEFKFSKPLVLAENLKSIAAINNFKFSEPVCKRKKTESANVSVNFKMPENKIPALKPKNKTTSEAKVVPVLKTGSVMDVLGNKNSSPSLLEKFKPSPNSWECSACLVRNTSEKSKCVACEAPKAGTTPIDNKGFGNQFKKPADKWECPVCLVQNANTDLKCVACTAAKPTAANPTAAKPTATNTPNNIQSDFGNEFKLPNDMWECSVCMVRNKNELAKCASCESPAPQKKANSLQESFSNKFKPPASTWECSTCLVRNKDEATKCIACETPRSNLKPVVANSFGGSFKIQSNEWECGVCMVRNKAENNKCQCCEAAKPGAIVTADAKRDKPISTFNFGIDKAAATSFKFGIPASANVELPKLDVKPSSVFGEGTKTTTAPSGGFSFGIPAESKAQEKPTETKPVVVEAQQKLNPLLKASEKLPEPAKTAPAGFKFGVTPSPIVPTSQVNQNTSNSVTTVDNVNKLIKSPNNSQTKVNMLSKNSSSSNLEGTTSVTSSPSTNLFTFGVKPSMTSGPLVSSKDTDKKSESNPNVTSTSLFKFGASNKPATNAAAPIFGSSIVSSSNNECSSTFPKSDAVTAFKMPAQNTSEVKPFSFVNSSRQNDEPAKKAPMFSFEPKAPTQQATQSAGFSFTATNTAPSFNFSATKTETSSNIFGAPTKSDSTPNGTTPTFNFGSTTNSTQKAAGFSFGAGSTSSTTAQTGFNFGSALAPATGKFNFTAATPAFDANAKPTFNFTAGSNAPSFTAQPPAEGVVPAGRKIKKALRRTQR